MKKFSRVLLVLCMITFTLSAKEGMWIPLLLEKYTIDDMQEMGFELSAGDIYDINSSSMKDAVVVFGGGCTGEMISDQGLLITNHHCGYRQIQAHSSLEHDYLTDGFWAMSRKEELPNPGLTVRFLEYMEDVTDEVLEGTEVLETNEREVRIGKNTRAIEQEASEKGKYYTQVKPLFYGNQYFLYVYKVFRDVRLVGAPPSAIGKFGGDADNWMWPRHTGDFSIFRVYADKNNEPADYHPDNVPYTPKKYFPISLEGVEPGDFTMVFGNPGSTMQYIPSHEVDVIMNQRDPDRIAIRDKKLEIIEAAMNADPLVRIQYAAKHASISNAWKKWQGEILGLQRLDAVSKKLTFEEEFKQWAIANGSWDKEYKKVFDSFDSLYPEYKNLVKAADYYSEIVLRGVELFDLASRFNNLINSIEKGDEKIIEANRQATAARLQPFFKDFNQPVDEKLFEVLVPMLYSDLKRDQLPGNQADVLKMHSNNKLVKKIYRKSILSDQQKLEALIEQGTSRNLLRLKNDPVIVLYNQLFSHYDTHIKPRLDDLNDQIQRDMQVYMGGIMEMKADQPLYPDANLTLRVTYGKVEGYDPKDGVSYNHYTTLDGVMEKDDTDTYFYNIPDRLRQLHEQGDYGIYGAKEGYMPVCFIASNHTTGGNSGSPIVNAKGHLVGVNFDRAWESTMSDIMYDPERCRNIAVDIRYALFIIDKYAGAGYLLDEMELIVREVDVPVAP